MTLLTVPGSRILKPHQASIKRADVAEEWDWFWARPDTHIFPFYGNTVDAMGYATATSVNTDWDADNPRGLAIGFEGGSGVDGILQPIGGAYGTTPNLTMIASFTLRSGSFSNAAIFAWGTSDNDPRINVLFEPAQTRWRIISNIVSDSATGTAVIDGTYTLVLTARPGGQRKLWSNGVLVIDATNSYGGTASTNYGIATGVDLAQKLSADYHMFTLLPYPISDAVAQKLSAGSPFGPITTDHSQFWGKTPAVVGGGLIIPVAAHSYRRRRVA